jgi:diguanylate cyclase (GGDEF)-like protein
LAGTRRAGRRLAVLIFDLDRFKEVNDTLGHPVGDALLKAVAERLRSCVRETTTVARLGGDEFAIIEDVTEADVEATALVARIQRVLSVPFDLGDHQVLIGTSIGIATAPGDGTDSDDILKNADLALYQAKADGRGTHRFFEAGMERGMVSPADFISLAEETGVIVPLGEWVIRTACQAAAGWPAGVKIAVNLSPAQFKSKELVPVVVRALADSGIVPHRLELEVTETVMMHDSKAAFATLDQLRKLGVRIALDDFGTGYSSLSFLQRFPFDKVKIDRSFVNELLDPRDESRLIARAVLRFAVSLGKTTTAEGVETKEQLELLRAEGCTEMQGYCFSPPRRASDIAGLFRKFAVRANAA